jgi:ParB family chromosome partitioning protein
VGDTISEETGREVVDTEVKIEQLKPYAKNPFNIPTGRVFNEMVASIKAEGILQPILARYTDEKNEQGNPVHEIISGHTRVEAAKKAGLSSVPAMVISIDDNQAAVKVVESNFRRNNPTPSELGRAFKLRLDALNNQGLRSDISSPQNGPKSSRDELAGMFNVSPSKVQRYTRLAYLIPAFQSATDNKEMSLSVAVDVSDLNEIEQKILHELIGKDIKDLTRQQSTMLKNAKKESNKKESDEMLTREQLIAILESETENKSAAYNKPVSKKAFFEKIATHSHFKDNDLPPEEMLEIVMKALDRYGNS